MKKNIIFLATQSLLSISHRNSSVLANGILAQHIDQLSSAAQFWDLIYFINDEKYFYITKSNALKLTLRYFDFHEGIDGLKQVESVLLRRGNLLGDKEDVANNELFSANMERVKKALATFDRRDVDTYLKTNYSFLETMRMIFSEYNNPFSSFENSTIESLTKKFRRTPEAKLNLRYLALYYSSSSSKNIMFGNRLLDEFGSFDGISAFIRELNTKEGISDLTFCNYVAYTALSKFVPNPNDHPARTANEIKNIMFFYLNGPKYDNEVRNKIAFLLKRAYQDSPTVESKIQLIKNVNNVLADLLKDPANRDIGKIFNLLKQTQTLGADLALQTDFVEYVKSRNTNEQRMDAISFTIVGMSYDDLKQIMTDRKNGAKPKLMEYSDWQEHLAQTKFIRLQNTEERFALLYGNTMMKIGIPPLERFNVINNLFDPYETLSIYPEIGAPIVVELLNRAPTLEEKLKVVKEYVYLNEHNAKGWSIVSKRNYETLDIADISTHIRVLENILTNLISSISTAAHYDQSIETINALLYEIKKSSNFYLKGSESEQIVSSIQQKLYVKWNGLTELASRGPRAFVESVQRYQYQYEGLSSEKSIVNAIITSTFTDSFYTYDGLANLSNRDFEAIIRSPAWNDPYLFQNSARLELIRQAIARGRYPDADDVKNLLESVYPAATTEKDQAIEMYLKGRSLSPTDITLMQQIHSRNNNQTSLDKTAALNVFPAIIKELNPAASLEIFLWFNNIEGLSANSEGTKALQKHLRGQQTANISSYVDNQTKFNSLNDIKNAFDLLSMSEKQYLLFYLLSRDSQLLGEPSLRAKLKTIFLDYANGRKSGLEVPEPLKLIYESMIRSYESEVMFGEHRIVLSEFYASVFPHLASISQTPEKIATIILQQFGLIGDKSMQLLSEENLPDNYIKEFAKARSSAREVFLFESLEWLNENLNMFGIKQKLINLGVQGLEDKEVLQWGDVFESVKQIGSASVKVVLGGTLKTEQKQSVAIMIMRKNLENSTSYALKMIRNVMNEMISNANVDSQSQFVTGLKVFVDRLERVTKKEFDFPNEADNIDRIASDLKVGDEVTKLRLVKSLGEHFDIEVSTPQVFLVDKGFMLMSEVQGSKLEEKDQLEALGIDVNSLYKRIIDVGNQQIFSGFADFDRHQGNWMAGTRDQKPVLIFIDAGQADEVTNHQRDTILSLFKQLGGKSVSSIMREWNGVLSGNSDNLQPIRDQLSAYLKANPNANSGQVLVELLNYSVKSGARIADGYDSIFQLLKMLQNYSDKIDPKNSYLEKSFTAFATEYWRDQNPKLAKVADIYQTWVADPLEKIKNKVLGKTSAGEQTAKSESIVTTPGENKSVEGNPSKDKAEDYLSTNGLGGVLHGKEGQPVISDVVRKAASKAAEKLSRNTPTANILSSRNDKALLKHDPLIKKTDVLSRVYLQVVQQGMNLGDGDLEELREYIQDLQHVQKDQITQYAQISRGKNLSENQAKYLAQDVMSLLEKFGESASYAQVQQVLTQLPKGYVHPEQRAGDPRTKGISIQDHQVVISSYEVAKILFAQQPTEDMTMDHINQQIQATTETAEQKIQRLRQSQEKKQEEEKSREEKNHENKFEEGHP